MKKTTKGVIVSVETNSMQGKKNGRIVERAMHVAMVGSPSPAAHIVTQKYGVL
jgi:hypothetical protein